MSRRESFPGDIPHESRWQESPKTLRGFPAPSAISKAVIVSDPAIAGEHNDK
jgi:hypothetical protein